MEETSEETTLTLSNLDRDAHYTFEVKTLAEYEEVQLEALSEGISENVTTCKSLGTPYSLAVPCEFLICWIC